MAFYIQCISGTYVNKYIGINSSNRLYCVDDISKATQWTYSNSRYVATNGAQLAENDDGHAIVIAPTTSNANPGVIIQNDGNIYQTSDSNTLKLYLVVSSTGLLSWASGGNKCKSKAIARCLFTFYNAYGNPTTKKYLYEIISDVDTTVSWAQLKSVMGYTDDPIHSDYVFKGWYSPKLGVTITNDTKFTVTSGGQSSYQLNAQWANKTYYISGEAYFKYNDGTNNFESVSNYNSSSTVTEGTVWISAPNAPTRSDYRFTGWYNNAEATGTPIAASGQGIQIKATTSGYITYFYAGWERIYKVVAAIEFDQGNVTSVSNMPEGISNSVEYTTSTGEVNLTIPNKKPIDISGIYRFQYWQYGSNTYFPGQSYSFIGSVNWQYYTLTAVWEKVPTVQCTAIIEYYINKDDTEYYDRSIVGPISKNPEDKNVYIDVTLKNTRPYYKVNFWRLKEDSSIMITTSDYRVYFSDFNKDADGNYLDKEEIVKVYGDTWTAYKWVASLTYAKGNIDTSTVVSNMPNDPKSLEYQYDPSINKNGAIEFKNGQCYATFTISGITPTRNDSYVFINWLSTKGNSYSPNDTITIVSGTTPTGDDGYTIEFSDTLTAQWTQGGIVYIFVDNKWKKAMPFIYAPNSSTDTKPWKVAIPYIYDNGKWKQTTV